MSLTNRLNFETLREVPFGGIGVNYAPIGAELAFPSINITIYNNTDSALMFGLDLDGLRDLIVLPANGTWVFDIGSNEQIVSGYGELSIPSNSTFYVKQFGVPTSGSVFLTSFYIAK